MVRVSVRVSVSVRVMVSVRVSIRAPQQSAELVLAIKTWLSLVILGRKTAYLIDIDGLVYVEKVIHVVDSKPGSTLARE